MTVEITEQTLVITNRVSLTVDPVTWDVTLTRYCDVCIAPFTSRIALAIHGLSHKE